MEPLSSPSYKGPRKDLLTSEVLLPLPPLKFIPFREKFTREKYGELKGTFGLLVASNGQNRPLIFWLICRMHYFFLQVQHVLGVALKVSIKHAFSFVYTKKISLR